MIDCLCMSTVTIVEKLGYNIWNGLDTLMSPISLIILIYLSISLCSNSDSMLLYYSIHSIGWITYVIK